MATAMWVYDSPPTHIERWRTGAAAERRTTSQLRPAWSVTAGWPCTM
jgi:hypothetical protein